ncbi:bifunctional oligoribonuclease/PAP phosphatase NrnA [Brucepastera parasyntrophica]|uniref:DHH family phosphoesterase n=1 Tax=Brucepastera parasyntrophica TaxID=2880008 RepID=UPI002109CF35|nr:bifunctional oligoribonuclease/PAP phosphatase NrnA [Brucepastera parasyntrophica]ULQ59764.1 bifunctional oligoribonuclease/PAP phosphatase NrnA [Brucepastera parasyntrophica]
MVAIPENLKGFLSRYSTYIIAGHREPDGDSIGSALALSSFLQRQGKQTILLSAGPFNRTEIKKYSGLFLPSISGLKTEKNTGLVIVDCSTMNRLGNAAEGLEAFPAAIIDHHATSDPCGENSFIISTVPATAILIQAIIEDSGLPVTSEEAEYLLFSVCTDTGFFRHLDSSGSETFHSVARLVEAGANPKKVFLEINGGKSFGSRIIISRILSRMVRYYSGKLVISYETMEDTREFGQEGRDSDTLYQVIQSIAGVEAIVIVRQESETDCSVGFRSLDSIDVSKIASSFGGGGHRQAAGLSIKGVINELIPQFVEAFAGQFPGIPA